MKVLVTGGAGYVGTTLVPQLLEKKYNVRVFDNLMFGGEYILPLFRNPNFQFYEGDIRDKNTLQKACLGVDTIIHLAAIVGFPACRKQPDLAKGVNVDGTRNLISVTSNSQLIIYASTGSNYGDVDEICTEETPLHPLSLYGQTKTLAERMLMEERNTIGWRFATAFGISPRMRLDLLINDFTYKAVTQGYIVVYESQFKRTFIHVYDMGRAFVFGIENQDELANKIYNVGSEKMNYSKKEICEIIKAKSGMYVHYADISEDQDKRNYAVSYKKINGLGFDTTISIEDGVDELVRSLSAIKFKTPYSNV